MLFKDYKKPAKSYVMIFIDGAFTDEEMCVSEYDRLVKEYGELEVITTVEGTMDDRGATFVDGTQTIYVNLKEKKEE